MRAVEERWGWEELAWGGAGGAACYWCRGGEVEVFWLGGVGFRRGRTMRLRRAVVGLVGSHCIGSFCVYAEPHGSQLVKD